MFGFDNIISSVHVHSWSLLVLYKNPGFDPFGPTASRLRVVWDGEYNLDPEFDNQASSGWCI